MVWHPSGSVSSVECLVSLGSGELRSGQLGPSEWCTLRWILKDVISDLLLAVSWVTPRRLHLLATKLTYRTRRSIKSFSALFWFYTKLISFIFYNWYFSVPPKEHPPLASSGRRGERGVQQHPSGHQELPGPCWQEQRYVSQIQEQAARLPVALQQARIRNVARQGPAIVYSGQHRHRDAQCRHWAQMVTGQPRSLERSTSHHIWPRQQYY